MKNSPILKKFKIPSRRTVIVMQYVGMLLALFIILLEMFFPLSLGTRIYWYFIASIVLGSGIMMRRYHDKE